MSKPDFWEGYVPEPVKPAPVQEPVAWMVYTQDGKSVYVTDNPTDIQKGQRALPLYTTPPAAQRQWVGLTVDELITLEQKHMRHEDLSRAIEAKLRSKNT
jgi:hypothetical protein